MGTQKISKIFDINSAMMRLLDKYFKPSGLNFLDKIKFTMLSDDYLQISLVPQKKELLHGESKQMMNQIN